MLALAQWAMASRVRAILVAACLLAIPMLFWMGAALVALALLQQESREGLKVALWSSLPAVGWMAAGDPTPFLIVAGCSVLALVLRQTVRFELVAIGAALLGEAAYFMLPALLGEILPLVIDSTRDAVAAALAQQPELRAEVLPYVGAVVQGGLAGLHTLVLILCMLLARYWQACIDNPGGFGKEFRQLRLPMGYMLPGMLLVFTAGQLQPELAGMVPVLTVPMAITGLAMLHAVVHSTATSPAWLAVVYVGLLVMGPYMYTLLIFVAALDSILNIRARLKDTASGDE